MEDIAGGLGLPLREHRLVPFARHLLESVCGRHARLARLLVAHARRIGTRGQELAGAVAPLTRVKERHGREGAE
jgi:hypothetical protein